MPELPEVETVVRGLRRCLIGETISSVTIYWARSIARLDPEQFIAQLTGRTVRKVDRRGKWIVVRLDDGQGLLVHLRMTGQLLLEPAPCPDDDYTRVVFNLKSGRRLRFSDMRKFGRLILTDNPGDVLDELGPEPLGEAFTLERFEHMMAERRGRVKSLLLDQRFLAGLGNIYVNEALWKARIHPLRPANSLSSGEVAALYRAVRSTLHAAIGEGGTTLENGNFRQADGAAGEFASQLLAYGHEGEPCPCCGARIERITVGQRGTYVCPACQPSPAAES